jgi:tetratricopeptide (TPR) repeat protein
MTMTYTINGRHIARLILTSAVVLSFAKTRVSAGDSDLMKTMSKEGGHISNTDKDLFSSSVRSAKSSIVRDMMDSFYSDAVDLQRERHYDEALELYEKILSNDPDYKDVGARRDTILKNRKQSSDNSQRRSAEEIIRQGDAALSKGLTLQALTFWRQALEKDPDNAAAKKKIGETTKAMARRQFESGYIHYKHNEMEDALDSWENAIAFDPSLKNRGLLLLMSKVELNLRQEQLTRLANQGYDQYQAGDLPASLKSYQELLSIQPRHDDARRMTAKIKIQRGQVEFKAAQTAVTSKAYPSAIEHYQNSLGYGWEPVKSQAGIAAVQHQMELARIPPPAPKPKATKPKPKVQSPPEGPDLTPPPAVAVDPKAAKEHYRAGLQAIRSKDYQRAIEELDSARQLDATDERIYMAYQRARQEAAAAQ